MENTKKKPQVRFKGFTDDWEQCMFDEIVLRCSTSSGNLNLPRVEYEDIISGKGELNKNIFKKKSTKVGIEFKKGDILYGKLRPYLKNWLLADFSGLAVGDFWILRPKETSNKFLYRLIQSNQFEKIANQSVGTKMPRADWKLVSQQILKVPNNIVEQEKIGKYFETLDKTIVLYQRKYMPIKKAINNIKANLHIKQERRRRTYL